MKNRFYKITLGVFFSVVLLLFCNIGYAENIDPDNDDSRYSYSENLGWINFEPSLGSGVTITDSAVEGYAWGENIGWINLSPINYGGVFNDGSGNLFGYAWGENAGWISFSCSNSDTCSTVDYGVAIDPATGEFSGKAWGENIGWIMFSSTGAVSYGITTSWGDDSDGNSDGNESGGGGCLINTAAYGF
jgi:hypothetical protein